MKNKQSLIILLLLVVVIGIAFFYSNNIKLNQQKTADLNNSSAEPMSTLTLSSSAFENNGMIPREYTCQGKGTSVPLTISGVPKESKSLALIMEDPDAPGGIWDHWIMWNIPTSTTEIAAGTVPAGAIQGRNSSGKNAYQGPCPPSGEHHYKFILIALPDTLSLPAGSKKADLLNEVRNKVQDQYILTALYKKP